MATYEGLAKRVVGLQTEYRPLLEQRRRQAETENVGELSDEELNRRRLELQLEDAVANGDTEAAARYRRYLAMSTESLLMQFLALDESKMPNPGAPSWVGPAAPQVRKGHVIYTLSRVNYMSTRDSINRHLQWGKPLDVEEMLMWLDEYEEHQL